MQKLKGKESFLGVYYTPSYGTQQWTTLYNDLH